MGANDDFKRLAKEMAEKARAQREKAEQAAQAGKSAEEEGQRPAADERQQEARPGTDRT